MCQPSNPGVLVSDRRKRITHHNAEVYVKRSANTREDDLYQTSLKLRGEVGSGQQKVTQHRKVNKGVQRVKHALISSIYDHNNANKVYCSLLTRTG